MTIPVVIIFFNRVEPLKRLVARLTEVKPPKVYLISDGPRDSREGEAPKVAECREFMRNLPWRCNVKCNFAEKNMGCRNRVISGLDWVFDQEDKAIILEDDCIPELAFFHFMECMLEKYAHEDKIISVGATNYCEKLSPKDVDVLFTKYPVSTGWGTWRRAWRRIDRDLELLSQAKETHQLRKWLGGRRAEWYWFYVLNKKKNSWAYRWAFTAFMLEKYCALSSVNLIENVGFDDPLATNTTDSDVLGFPAPNKTWSFKQRLPNTIEVNQPFDNYLEDSKFSKSTGERIKWLCRKIVKHLTTKRKKTYP